MGRGELKSSELRDLQRWQGASHGRVTRLMLWPSLRGKEPSSEDRFDLCRLKKQNVRVSNPWKCLYRSWRATNVYLWSCSDWSAEFPGWMHICFQNASSREVSVVNYWSRFLLPVAVGSTAKQHSFGWGHCSSKVFVSFQHSDWPSLYTTSSKTWNSTFL